MEKVVKAKYLLWDCESSLYDAVELKSIQRHLNSAILSSRSLSMPRFMDPRCPVSTHVTAPAPAPALLRKSSSSRIVPRTLQSSYSRIVPRTLQRLVISFFKSKPSNNNKMSSFDCDG